MGQKALFWGPKRFYISEYQYIIKDQRCFWKQNTFFNLTTDIFSIWYWIKYSLVDSCELWYFSVLKFIL